MCVVVLTHAAQEIIAKASGKHHITVLVHFIIIICIPFTINISSIQATADSAEIHQNE